MSPLKHAPRRLTGATVPLVAAAAGLAVMALGARVETAIITAVGATGHQLEWISDVVAAIAVSCLTYLWLHLRLSRLRLLDLERAEIARDEQLRLAAEIQRTLLPHLPATTAGYSWFARMETANEVGGDFYDFVPREDGSILLILGDVSGKGIPAALLQASLLMLFRVHASTTRDPATIAGRMSRDLREKTGGRPYATAIIARVDARPPRITYVNAGHPPGQVWRDGHLIELSSGGPPLGLLSDVAYDAATIDLEPDDLGIFVTDGITEVLDELPEAARTSLAGSRAWHAATPDQVCERLLTGTREPATDVRQAIAPPDDRTVLAFRALRLVRPERPSNAVVEQWTEAAPVGARRPQ